jgi:hypothetical protein
VLDSVDDGTRARALDALAQDLRSSTVIHISRKGASDPMFSRVLHLVKDVRVRRLVRQKEDLADVSLAAAR